MAKPVTPWSKRETTVKWAHAAAARGAPPQPEGLLIVARKEPEDRAFKGKPPGLLVLRHGMIPGT